MKAAQITQYTKNIRIKVNNVPIPKMGDHDVLIRVKAAAVNPVDILNLTGAVRLIQDYRTLNDFMKVNGWEHEDKNIIPCFETAGETMDVYIACK